MKNVPSMAGSFSNTSVSFAVSRPNTSAEEWPTIVSHAMQTILKSSPLHVKGLKNVLSKVFIHPMGSNIFMVALCAGLSKKLRIINSKN